MAIRLAGMGNVPEQWETSFILSWVQLCEHSVEGYIEFTCYPENQREIGYS